MRKNVVLLVLMMCMLIGILPARGEDKFPAVCMTTGAIPIYILLTPLRFVNALYYNMVVHCSFEMFNYIVEVINPIYNLATKIQKKCKPL